MNIQFPISWLRDYLKTDTAAKTITSHLTASGPSVERMEKVGEDYVLDVEVTTNRPDAYSVFGIAREAHAILKSNGQKSTLLSPKGLTTSLDPDITNKAVLDVNVTNYNLCPRFTAIILEVKIGESPAVIKNRLSASGIRPINNIVDITNYVMLELGQPMHAFDYDKINGSKMTLRPSHEGEKLTTLDGVKRNLPKETIVIEDTKHLIDLCGIMGGENSQITSRTKRVVFFVQAYDPVTIRRTTQALAFRTDAAARFEKGVDLENILPVLRRAVYLAKETAGAKIISELIDIYPKKQNTPTVKLDFIKLDKYLGIDFDRDKAAQILKYLGFEVVHTANILTATAPSWRANDVESDVDLIEEIARVYGYHNLPSALPKGEVPNRRDSILKDVIDLKKQLKALGLTEVLTYSIISKNMLKITGIEEKDAVELSNPLTEEWQFMRPTIIPSLLDVIAKNKNLKEKIKIYEIAKTYDNQKDLPQQDLKIALAASRSNFYEIKGIVENLFDLLNRKPKFEKFTEESTLVEKSASAIVKVADQAIGGLGMINQSAASHFGLEPDTAVAELNLTKIYGQPSSVKTFRAIAKFPPVIEDISAIYSVNTPLATITSEIKNSSELIKKIEVIDIFEDPKLGEDKKSITLRLTYQKSTGTPTQDEVNIERAKTTKALEDNLRAKVRK